MNGTPPVIDKLRGLAEAAYSFVSHSEVGSIASVAGLAITIWVLVSVSDIRKRVLLRLRAPDAIKELSARASAISNALQDFDASLPIIEENIELANETLKSLFGKVTGQAKGTIKIAMKEVRVFRKLPRDAKTRDAVRAVYVQLLVSVKAIENLVADFRMEP